MRVRLLVYVFIIILISVNAHAFGISYEYLENNSLRLYPGQNYMFKLTIQNKDEEEVKVNISLDSAIATLVGGPVLKIPGKTYDRHVFFNITVPEHAQVGDMYNLNYVVSPVGKGEGQVPLAVRYKRNFKVLVVHKPEKPELEQPAPVPTKPLIPKWVFIPVVIIIIFVLITLIWRKSHQMSGKLVKEKPASKVTRPSGPFQIKVKKHEPRGSYENAEHNEGIKHAEQKLAHLKESKKERTLSTSEYFHLSDGRKLKDLEDMYNAMKNMTPETFKHHVSSTKNDFANWIAHSLKKQELANKLFRTNTQHEMLKLMKNELDKQ